MTHEKASHQNKLEQADIGKLMTELCLQTTFSIMIYNFYTITDTFFVASKIGSAASGAIGIFSVYYLNFRVIAGMMYFAGCFQLE